MMNRVLIFFIVLSGTIFSQTEDISIFERWHNTDVLIRDRNIPRRAAIDSIKMYVKEVKNIEELNGEKIVPWSFPMRGWTEISYRQEGEDYRDAPFDYFQGGDSYGHPANDIFILDKDSNVYEDRTGKKVEALSMVYGVVISSYTDWKPGNKLRGGNYIKIFDPRTNAIFYYSHLDTVFKRPGDIVNAGDAVGIVGRTGRKAIHGRTHIHVAYYPIRSGYPQTKEIIEEIYKSEERFRKENNIN